jgi:putative addiction module component (TIGR02574 family)
MPATRTPVHAVDALDEQVMALPPESQFELARRIIERLDDEEVSEEEAEAYWAEEIKRRLDEFDAGLVEGIPAEEAFDRLRQDLRGE